MAKRKQALDEQLPLDGEDAAATEQVISPENTSGGEEPEVNSEQLAVSGEPLAVIEEVRAATSQLPAAPVRPQATDQVFVKCVVSQAVLDSQMMLQGEIRLVAYGLYRQAWAGNAAAFLVRLPGASGYIRETE